MRKLWIIIAMGCILEICPSMSLYAQRSYGSDSMIGHQSFFAIGGGYGYSLQRGIGIHQYTIPSSQEFSDAFLPMVSVSMAFETVDVENHSWRQWPPTRWEKDASSWLFQCEYRYTKGWIKQENGALPTFRTLVGDTVLSPSVFNADVSLSVLQLDVLHKYRLGWWTPFYVAVGGTVGWAVSGRKQESAHLQGNNPTTKLLPIKGATIDEQGQRAILPEESLSIKNALRFGLKAGILYEIKALPSNRSPVNALTLIPSLWLEYPAVNVQGEYSLKALSVHLGLSISFAITNPSVFDVYEDRYITPAEFPDYEPYHYPLYRNP